VVSRGTINVTGEAEAEATASWDILGMHLVFSLPAVAGSTATGITSGGDGDVIKNYGDINVTALARVVFPETPTDSLGAQTANATSVGIDAGDGHNLVKNWGTISVTATAHSDGTGPADAEVFGITTGSGGDTIIMGVDTEVIGTALAHAPFDADVRATGIDGGAGDNFIMNDGTVRVTGDSDTIVDGDASVFGIRTGSGSDTIVVGADAEVTAAASGGGVFGSGDVRTMGIDAGDGDNIVQNQGTVSVVADLDALFGGNVDAYGIRTGSGNDSIANSGIIDTVVNGTLGAGIAISSGGGDDTVALLDGSETTGDIDLGSGDDAIWFAGNPVIYGSIDGSADTDSLVFEGEGSVSVNPLSFETARKQGSGTYTVSGLPTMERVEVDKGTLVIDHDYQFASDGTFQATIYRCGYGQLQVNGTAGLDGTLALVPEKRAYRNGDTFDVLTANDVVDEFSTLDLPSPRPLLQFDVHYLEDPDRVRVEALTRPCTTVAKNSLQKAIAQYLDTITPTANGDLSEAIGNFQALSKREFETAFWSLSPSFYDNATRTTFSNIFHYTHVVQQRMHSVRAHLTMPGLDLRAGSEEKPILLAYNGSDAGLARLLSKREQARKKTRYGLWLQGFSQWGDQDETDGFAGFDYGMAGLTLGFDYALTDRLLAGVEVGYSYSDIDLSTNLGDGDIESTYGGLYGMYFTDRAYLEGVFTYGKNRYDSDRNVVVGAMQRVASSDHDGDAFSGALEAGYTFPVKEWLFQPFGSLQYTYLDEEGFEETGAGALNMIVDDRQTESLVSQLGLRLGRAFPTASGSLVPEVSLAWKYDFDIDDDAITASFAGSPNVVFSVEGHDVEQHGAVFGAGLTFLHKAGISASVTYNGELREDYNAHGIIGVIRYVF